MNHQLDVLQEMFVTSMACLGAPVLPDGRRTVATGYSVRSSDHGIFTFCVHDAPRVSRRYDIRVAIIASNLHGFARNLWSRFARCSSFSSWGACAELVG
jgi:hypothetical protein